MLPALPLAVVLLAGVPERPAPRVPTATAAATEGLYQPQAEDVVTVGDLPAIGKWMLDRRLQPASWLGALVHGRHLREPINVVLLDTVAGSSEEAVARLVRACGAAGYKSREGHSGGYSGYLGGTLFAQIPSREGHAFSNDPFEFHNNHGRIFGPLRVKDGWLFIGALSREKFDPLTKAEHVFVSFNQARDDFARKLDAATGYGLAGHVELGNVLGGDAEVTTADHDGRAVLLRVER